MNMNKKNVIRLATLAVGMVLVGFYVWSSDVNDDELTTPDVQGTSGVQTSPNISPSPGPKITKVPVPLPTGDGKTTFIGETVPWSLLLADASCELKGEIKYLNHNTYDNQDALFIYKGIDHPGRNIFWTITPQDNISVGPNIFNKIPIPNGESLLGISLPENPKSKAYDITAKIQYGRLVDANGKFVTAGGTVKLFEKQCQGKTTVVLP